MAGRHPNAIQSGLALTKAKWERLDPRILVRATARENVVYLEFAAKETIECEFRFNADEMRAKQIYSEWIGKGLPTAISPGEIEVIGSPLLAELFRNSGMVHSQMKIGIDVDIEFTSADGKHIRIPLKDAAIEGGTEEMRLNATVEKSILILKSIIPKSDNGKLNMRYEYNRWAGQPILNLAFFDQIKALFDSLMNGGSARLAGSIQGNEVFAATLPPDKRKEWKTASAVLNILAKARTIAR